MLPWPPPGTESLHALLGRVRFRSTLAGLLVALPTLFLALDPGYLVPDMHAVWVLGLTGATVVLGVALWVGAALAVMGVVDGIRRGARLGYSRSLLMEIAADTPRDGGALLGGTGAYRGVASETRSSLRRLRVWRGWIAAAGAALPAPSAVAALLLAFRGGLGPAGMVLLTLAPGATLLLVAAVLAGWERGAAALDRGAAAWDPDPSTPEDRANGWRQDARAAVGLEDGPRGVRWLLVVAGATGVGALFVALLLAVTMAASAVVTVGTLAAAGSGSIPVLTQAWVVRAVLDGAAPDSTLDATRAGVALHELLGRYAGPDWSEAVAEGVYRPSIAVPAAPASPRLQRLARLRTNFGATPALDPESREALADRPPPPSLELLETVGWAASADVLGPRIASPYAAQVADAFDSPAWEAMRALYTAGLAEALANRVAGRNGEAEAMLRALLRFGDRVAWDSPLPGEAAVAASGANVAAWALVSLMEATGRAAEAGALEGALRTSRSARRGLGELPQSTSLSATVLARLAADEERPRSERWNAYVTNHFLTRCGSVNRVLFADVAREDPAGTQLWASLAPTPADSAVLSAAIEPPPRRFFGRGAAAFVGRLLGERVTGGLCGQSLRWSPRWQ